MDIAIVKEVEDAISDFGFEIADLDRAESRGQNAE
jgi:hypothetical protein